jgi:hypothetical protein
MGGQLASGYSGVARTLSARELAQEVARQELAAVKAERAAPRLLEAVRLGKLVGLSVAEMERMAGCSRQTIYNALNQEDDRRIARDRASLARQVLVALVAAHGGVPLGELAHRLGLSKEEITPAVLSLQAEQLCLVASAGYADPDKWEATSVRATPLAEDELRSRFDELFLARSSGFCVYIAVRPEEVASIREAAREILSNHEHTLMEARIAPSVMDGPELACVVHAPTSRAAIAIARDVWAEIRDLAGLEQTVAEIVAVASPAPSPSAESEVLDSFVQAINEHAKTDTVGAVLRERMRYGGGVPEYTLAVRCLTAAARVLRRSVGQEHEPRLIADGDAAWGELMAATSLDLDATRESIQKAAVEALRLAAERLGPFLGGERGAFLGPGKSPRVVEEVKPTTHQELVYMAMLAGVAVGKASFVVPKVDPAGEVTAVIAGSP